MVDSLANRKVGLVAFLVTTLVLSSLAFLQIPERAAAASPSAGQDILLDPVKPIIYWAGAEGNDLKFINSSTGEIIDSIVIGPGPSSICLSSDGTILYVPIPSYKCIIVVDANSHAITGNISLSFYPLSVRLDGKGFMYVSGCSDDAGWIYSINMLTWKVKNSVAPGFGNLAIEISPDGSTLLAMQMGFTPNKIYKYGINSGVFNYLDVDNHDLGSFLENEVVDWARAKIYMTSGAPYGIEIVSIATLDNLGMYPMDAYPSCMAMSADGRFLYGAHYGYYSGSKLWMFNATDGSPMGSMFLPSQIEYLAVAHDLRNAYVGLPIQRIPLRPVIEHMYPVADSLLGYTPRFFEMRTSGGLPHYDGQNATIFVDGTPLDTYQFDMYGNLTYYRANHSQVLPDGNHNFSVALLWADQIVWGNATFGIDRSSSVALKPAIHPENPNNGSIQAAEPLTISSYITYTSFDLVVEGGWIKLDYQNLSTTFALNRLSSNYGIPPSLGWHNVSAYIYWDGGLGEAWTNWSFLVMQGPLMTPVYPASGQVLTQMPDRIEVAIDYRDTGGNVSAPQLYLDGLPMQTTITQNGTMRAWITSTLRTGNHSVNATLDWAAGKIAMTWWFTVDIFMGPNDELLVRHEYKDEFSLLVPTGVHWTLEEDSDISGEVFPLVLYGPIHDNFRTNIIVTSTRDRAVEETEAYLEKQLDQAIDDLEQSGTSVDIVIAPEMRIVDNHTAYVATIQLEGYYVYQEMAIVASESHERYWVLIFSISEGHYYTYDDMFDRIIDGFRIEMKPTSTHESLGQAAIGLGIAALAGGLAGTVVWLTRRRREPAAPK